jgi:iron complex transport system permease protein
MRPHAPLLEVRGLRQQLSSRRVLDDVSFEIHAGEILGLIGANGSGKTTLLRTLAGILPAPLEGIRVNGQPLRALSPRQRAVRIGYLPQLHVIPAGFRVWDLVEMGRHPHTGESPVLRRRAVDRALERIGIPHLSARRLETLSGGELQKAFLASVVAQEPLILLLDEPTVFLDPGGAGEIQQALLQLASERYAIVAATHDLPFVRRAASAVLGIRHGRILLEGNPSSVLSDAALSDLYGTSPAVGGSRSPAEEPPGNAPDEGQPEAALRGDLTGFGERRIATRLPLLGLALCCVAVLVVAPFVGAPLPAPGEAAGVARDPREFILWQLRIPRVLLAAIAGAALSVAGATFQSLFRNPLATPYTLGVASGAAFGAVLTLIADTAFAFPVVGATSVGALLGAIAITGAVYMLGRRGNALPTATLLLAGVTLSFFFSALILLLQYLADFTAGLRILRWLMGEIRVLGYGPFAILGPLAAVGCLAVSVRRGELNLLLTGEELAQARGVDVEKEKLVLFGACSLMVGGVVAFCGPIGFVGLIVPHALRALIGPDHRPLILACLPAGAAFLVLCDTVARLALAPAELPVGVVTALIGGPFFLTILLRRKAYVSV